MYFEGPNFRLNACLETCGVLGWQRADAFWVCVFPLAQSFRSTQKKHCPRHGQLAKTRLYGAGHVL